MIYISYGTIAFKDAPRQYIRDIDAFFDGYVEDDWMIGELPKRIVKEIDNSDLIAPKVIESPVLGQIPYTWLSGGSKILLMMNKIQDIVYDGDNLGDNCWPLFLELGKTRDIAISLSYYPSFKWVEGCKVMNLDTNKLISNRDEFMDAFLDSDYRYKERHFSDIKWPIMINTDRFKLQEIDF